MTKNEGISNPFEVTERKTFAINVSSKQNGYKEGGDINGAD